VEALQHGAQHTEDLAVRSAIPVRLRDGRCMGIVESATKGDESDTVQRTHKGIGEIERKSP
jgi:hypothetical protein